MREKVVIREPDTNMNAGKKIFFEGMKIYDPRGMVTAAVDEDGYIHDKYGRLLARYTKNGDYISATGKKLARVDDGIIRTTDDNRIFAHMGDDGRIYGGDEKYIGTVAEDGTVLNSRGVRLGSAPGVDRNIIVLYFFFPRPTPLPDGSR